MTIHTSLFEGEHICLAPIETDKDAEIQAKWTESAEFLRLLSTEPAIPASPEAVKKRYEAIEKKMETDRNLFYFTIRLRPDDRLIGFAQIYWIEWAGGYARLQLGIGLPDERGKGYGSEALRLLLRYAFSELNLFRLDAIVGEDNLAAMRLFQKAGFVEEVRQRQALYRDGRRWDLIGLGLLKEEWSASHA